MLFDLLDVVDGARKIIAEEGLTNPCEIISGDFFGISPARR